MDIEKMVNALDLVYYEYDGIKNMIIKDAHYANKHTEAEFFKLTYHLSKHHIPFTVSKAKNIYLAKKTSKMKELFKSLFENFTLRNRNIFLLNDHKVKGAKNLPLFTIKHLNKEIDVTEYDAIVFTSRNAIDAIEKIDQNWHKIPSYVISKQTAKLAKNYNAKVAFIGKTKHGNEFAQELLAELKGKKVLYLRGKEVVSNLIEIFEKNSINCTDIVVYENSFNEKLKNKKLPKKSKIIFTSPSTIKYFFQVYTWDDSYTAISIGNTTAKYFPEHIEPLIPEDTSFKSCVDLALSLK